MKIIVKKQLSKYINGGFLKQFYRFNSIRAIKIDQLQLIYVPIPKVANHSMKRLLAHKIGMSGKISAHKYNWNYIDLKSVAPSPNYSFGFVRNPLDRLVSCYVQKVEMNDLKKNFWKYGNQLTQGITFRNFAEFVCQTPDSIADRHFKSQHCFLFHNDQLIVDYLGRFENLKEDWKEISQRYELPSLSHINKSIRLDLNNYYSRELAEMVADRYQKDIKLLGYESDVASFIAELH